MRWKLLSPVVLLDERRHPLGLGAQVPGVPHQVVQLPFQLLSHRLDALQALQRFLKTTNKTKTSSVAGAVAAAACGLRVPEGGLGER